MSKPIILDNNVTKGVHSDNTHQLQPEGTARSSINGRIVDNQDGNYAWETMLGNSIIFTLRTDAYPIGYIELIDKVIIFSTDDSGAAGGYGEIGVLEINSSGIGTYTPIYFHLDLRFSTRYPISGFGIKETDDIERIYFTDNFNYPRVLNISDLYPPLTSSDTYENAKTYLVVQGTLTYTILGTPTDFNAGQTFTFVSGAVITGTGLAVPYTPVNLFNFSPELSSLPILSFKESIVGSLHESTYFFVVRLCLNEGYKTPFLCPTNPISVFDNKTAVTDIDAYQESIPYGDGRLTSVGLRLSLSNIDENFDYVEIIGFEASNWDEANAGFLAVKTDITGSSMEIDITDDYAFGDFGIEDIIINPIPIDLIKTMSMIKNRSTIGHIKERNELDQGQQISGDLYSEVYQLPTDHMITIGIGTTSPKGLHGNIHQIPATKIIPNDTVIPGQWYKVAAGSLRYPASTGTTYTAGDVFQGEDNEVSWDNGSSEEVNAIIRIKKYWDRSNSVIVYNDHILEDWYDYKSKVVADKMQGYWDDKYRIGLLPIDKKGNPMYVRWIDDIDIPVRQIDNDDTNTFGETGAGTRSPVSSRLLISRSTGEASPYGTTYNANAMSIIINNLDLTDIIDDISAFQIVRAPRKNQTKFEAIMHPIRETTQSQQIARIADITGPTASRIAKKYKLYSPELSIGFGSVEKNDDVAIIQRYVTKPSPVAYTTTIAQHYKMYSDLTVGSRVPIGEINDILESYPLEVDLDPTTPAAYGDDDVENVCFNQNPCEIGTLIETKRAEDGVDLPTTGFGDLATEGVVVKIKRKNADNYGGSDDYKLENTEYMPVGHFQVVDDAFKAAIVNGSNYIVDSIQIFGGDCFVGVWSYLHDYNFTEGSGDPNNYPSNGYHFPMQSRVNLALISGRNFARLRYYSGTTTTGIRYSGNTGASTWELFKELWEDRSYSLGYSNELYNFGYAFPGLPASFSEVSVQDKKTRFSEVKFNGADIDVFRRYLVDNERDLNYDGGPLTALMSRGDKLYYWQERTVGYIPVSERAMKNSDIGFPIQMGIGGIFERNDDVLKTFGCQHQYSIIETDQGFGWVDWDRKAIVHMSYDFGLKENSEIFGLKRILKNMGDSASDSDAILYDKGILSGYNYLTKEIYVTIKSDTTRTFIINSYRNMWVGEINYYPHFYASLKKHFLTTGMDNFIYKEGAGAWGVFYGVTADSELSIILNQNYEVKKFFRTARTICGKNFFDTVKFEMWYNESTKVFEQTVTETVLNNPYFEQLFDSWDFAFPLQSDGEWFKGHFMKITFTVLGPSRKIVKFIKLLTETTNLI